MKYKTKLFAIVFTAIVCISAVVVGVWAIVYREINLNNCGQFTFYGVGVNADVSGRIYGFADSNNPVTTNSTQDSNYKSLTTLNFRANANASNGCLQDVSSWNNIPLTFSFDGDPITIEITITNKSTTKPLNIKITDKTFDTIQGLTIRILKYDSTKSDYVLDNMISLPEENQTSTFKVIMSPTGTDAVTGTYNIGVKMSVDPLQAVDKDDLYQQEFSYRYKYQLASNHSYAWTDYLRTDWFVNMGKFPQRYVSTGSQIPLQAAPTNTYITLKSTINSSGQVADRSFEIYFDANTGREFIKVDGVIATTVTDVEAEYSSGESVVTGNHDWFELQPIKWLVLGYYNLNPDGSLKYTSETNTNTDITTITYDTVGRFNSDGTENTSFNPKQNNIQLKLLSHQTISVMRYDGESAVYNDGVTGESCDMRLWLNGSFQEDATCFKNQAFNSTELNQLQNGNDYLTSENSNIKLNYENGRYWTQGNYQYTANDKVWLISENEIQCQIWFGVGYGSFVEGAYNYSSSPFGCYSSSDFARGLGDYDFVKRSLYSLEGHNLFKGRRFYTVWASYHENYLYNFYGVRPAIMIKL